MFLLNHQDGDIEYIFEKGGYAIQDSKLYLSIETRAVVADAFPRAYCFALDGYPIRFPAEDTIIQISSNPDDIPPSVYVYTTYHACEVEAEIELKVLSASEINVKIKVISEDVSYNNEKARRNPFTGTVDLLVSNLNELWIPV